MYKNIILATAVILASGCSSVASYKTDDNPTDSTSRIETSKIEVYSTDLTNRKYKILGEVVASADAGEDASDSVKLLKKEAAKFGADAIINLRLSIDQGYWQNAIKSTGTAIVFEG
jgi:uncharacterized protein YceK